MRDEATQKRVVTAALALAIFAAPFLALLVSIELALAVLAAGLTASGLLLRGALPAVADEMQPRLRLVVAINLLLAFVCFLAVVMLLLG